MNPTWQSDCGSVKLWLGDCLDVMRTWPDGAVDAVVTDPPYENMQGGIEFGARGGVARRVNRSKTIGKELGISEGLIHVPRIAVFGCVSFCSFHWIAKCQELIQGRPVCLVTWYKRNSPPSVANAPQFSTEYAWAVKYNPGIRWRSLKTHFDIPMLQAGCMSTERITINGLSAHPTQKPLSLMAALILPGMQHIADPFMGSGTTGVAAVRLGRQFWGVEIDPAYFEIAKRRIQDELRKVEFLEPERKHKQRTLIEDGDDN